MLHGAHQRTVTVTDAGDVGVKSQTAEDLSPMGDMLQAPMLAMWVCKPGHGGRVRMPTVLLQLDAFSRARVRGG